MIIVIVISDHAAEGTKAAKAFKFLHQHFKKEHSWHL
jgi:hypothetical protein